MSLQMELVPIQGIMLGAEWVWQKGCFIIDLVILRIVIYYSEGSDDIS